jgi:hypothetical protein
LRIPIHEQTRVNRLNIENENLQKKKTNQNAETETGAALKPQHEADCMSGLYEVRMSR